MRYGVHVLCVCGGGVGLGRGMDVQVPKGVGGIGWCRCGG